MSKFGFKKDDFGNNVGNVRKGKPGVWSVSQETVTAVQAGSRRASAVSSGCGSGK